MKFSTFSRSFLDIQGEEKHKQRREKNLFLTDQRKYIEIKRMPKIELKERL
jgi:hypothetical protein